MKSSITCRVVAMLARLNGTSEEDSERCLTTPTHRVLMRVDPGPGIRVEVLAEVCREHWLRASKSGAFVNYWPLDRSRPDPAATSPAAGL